MSTLTLESLPNEILSEIFEKYINGIDLLRAFAFQLNRRFDLLILRCQRFRFDFIRCHKNDFSFAMGLLPAYIDQIQQLALSEQNTPGQIHAFLHYFPSFTRFKHLHKLYIHINTETVQPYLIEQALHSLSKTSLHTLSMKIIKSLSVSSFENIIVELFRMKTLKRLILSTDNRRANWAQLNDFPSNLEYLTLDGIFCQIDELKSIFQCASSLQYLNAPVNPVYYYSNNSKSKTSSQNSIKQLCRLHTMILKTDVNDEGLTEQLEPYLKCMPALNRLEIKLQNELSDITAWETLLKTSAPNLTHFKLEAHASDRNDLALKNLLESLQTPFWLEKKNFHIIIKEFGVFNYWETQANQSMMDMSVNRWLIQPQRNHTDNEYATNTITNVKLSIESNSLLQDRYLNNVNKLAIEDFNDNLFELITTHVNCSQIKYLDVSKLSQKSNNISSFLPYVKNIVSIRIQFNQLYDKESAYLSECKNIKFVDLSTGPHKFHEKDIALIRSMFSNVEHLIINTRDLRKVPLLQTCIPCLRSLTFPSVDRYNVYDNNYDDDNDYAQKRADFDLRQSTQFLFYRESNNITVWIDKAALQDPYWTTVQSYD